MRFIKTTAVLLTCFLLCGCNSTNSSKMEVTYFAMDTVMTFRVLGDNESAAQAMDGLGSRLGRYEAMWSVTDDASEVSSANRGEAVVLQPETEELILFALEMNELTDGALDITMYPVVREWGFTTGEYRVPDAEDIGELLTYTGSDKVSIEDGVLRLERGTEIDLGAVAKGYTGDLIAAHFREQGVTSALLDLGGNVHVIGSNPDGSPWRLGIRDPFSDGNIAVLELSDRVAVTSGGYERYFIKDGSRYCHIIDPASGMPAHSGLSSVTIVGERGAMCDALSTAIYVMGSDAAEQLWREHGGFEMILIDDYGNIIITDGVEGIFTPTSSFDGKVDVLRR